MLKAKREELLQASKIEFAKLNFERSIKRFKHK